MGCTLKTVSLMGCILKTVSLIYIRTIGLKNFENSFPDGLYFENSFPDGLYF
jgi:hypothetical protein